MTKVCATTLRNILGFRKQHQKHEQGHASLSTSWLTQQLFKVSAMLILFEST